MCRQWKYVDATNEASVRPSDDDPEKLQTWLDNNEAIIACIHMGMSIALQYNYEHCKAASQLFTELRNEHTPRGIGPIHDAYA